MFEIVGRKDSVVEERQELKTTLFTRIKKIKGLKLYKLDSDSNVSEVEYEETNSTINGGLKHQVRIEPNCLYFPALNSTVAVKKANNLINSVGRWKKEATFVKKEE